MVERPILFSGPMVRAILDGRKTQTRRVVKYIPVCGEPSAWCAAAQAQEPGWVHIVGDYRRFCPYGVPGDRMWVKERHWRNIRNTQDASGEYTSYRGRVVEYDEQRQAPGWHNNDQYGSGWMARCPSIHMPRWASRLTLEVVSVRVERLNDISEEDAIAEGLSPLGTPDLSKPKFHGWMDYSGKRWSLGPGYHLSPIASFRSLWDSINEKKHPWASNPWVWVVAFKRLEAASG